MPPPSEGPSMTTLALALLALTAAPDLPPPPAGVIRCTPTTISPDGGAPQAVRNPIARALDRAGPGTLIQLGPGDYPPFCIGFGKPQAHWNTDTPGGTAAQPIVIQGGPRTRIAPTGPDSHGDTIAVNNRKPSGHITFRELTIVPGYRAGVIFYMGGPEVVYPGFRFHDCDILGGWNHLTARGSKSRWGVWGYGLADFEFRGLTRRAVIKDIEKEHAFYLQNSKGDITIENVEGRRLGRTFFQLTARPGDGPPGVGDVTLRDCLVVDATIAAGDNFKGGSALTFCGRQGGTITVEGCTVRAGFDPKLRHLTRPEMPYGTGALVCWDRGAGAPNARIVLRDNRFELAPGCGDRPLVSLGGCTEVRIEGSNRFLSGGEQPALDLDPLADRRLLSSPNGSVVLDPECELRGAVRIRGKVAGRAQIEELSRPPEEDRDG